jgi:hypothetical protein
MQHGATFKIRNLLSFYGEGVLAPRQTPQTGEPPFVGCQRLFIQYTRSYTSGGLLLLSQHEDAKCCGGRNPTYHGRLLLLL